MSVFMVCVDKYDIKDNKIKTFTKMYNNEDEAELVRDILNIFTESNLSYKDYDEEGNEITLDYIMADINYRISKILNEKNKVTESLGINKSKGDDYVIKDISNILDEFNIIKNGDLFDTCDRVYIQASYDNVWVYGNARVYNIGDL